MHVGITAAAQATIAASGLAAGVKTWAAAQTPGLTNGFVVSFLLKKIAGANVNIIVGVTLSSSNIATEYAKIYSGVDGAVASNIETVIFAPLSDRALILQYNLAQTNRDTFQVSGLNTEAEAFSYLGVPIEFVECQGMNGSAATGVPVRYMAGPKSAATTSTAPTC
jgi:hypothetical protein